MSSRTPTMWRLAVLALIVLTAAQSLAQQEEASGLPVMKGRGRYGLAAYGLNVLATPEAGAELKLSAEQAERVRDLRTELQRGLSQSIQPLLDLRGAELEAKATPAYERFASEAERRLGEILEPGQLVRYRQIMRQLWGPSSWAVPDTLTALKLTEQQKTEYAAIRNAYLAEARALLGPPGDSVAHSEMLATLIRRRDEQLLSLLTDDQRKVWSELTGPPFARPASLAVERRPPGT